jgi:hypothetical protein
MRNMRNAPSRIKYHLRPTYAHLAAVGHFCARASKRSSQAIAALIVALFALTGSAFAQGTPVPYAIPQYFDANGDPLASGGICTYEAGTTTLASVYTTSALTPGTEFPNPVRLNAAGRPSVSGVTLGIFLSPGRAYKFVLKDATVTTCSPDTGVTLWSVDNVQAVPGSGSSLDTTGTAGEAIAAGDVVFLSTGAGGLNAGQWYKTDADLVYKSTGAFQVGVAPSAISSGATGTIRLGGAVTVTGPLSAGAAYYVSATAGAMTTTAPPNAIRIGAAQSSTAFIVGHMDAPVSPRGPPCGRLTLTSGLPVTINDVTAATTIYYTPAGSCNTIDLYDGTAWSTYAFAELSIAVPATTNTGYDVFAYDNAGVVALELTAWASLTARATAITLQNGVYVKSGTPTRRLLGSFRTTSVSGQTEDSVTKRYVANLYNRVPRALFKIDSTVSWAYTTATIRQARADATNQVEVFQTVQDAVLDLTLTGHADNSSGVSYAAGIGEDSTTTFLSAAMGSAADTDSFTARVVKMPAIGSHTYSWNEWSAATGTTTWYGSTPDSTPAGTASGLRGWIQG